MTVENIKIFLQNICKNSLLVNTLLETLIYFDIILIQQPHGLKSVKYPAPQIAREIFSWAPAIILTGWPSPEFLWTIKTS